MAFRSRGPTKLSVWLWLWIPTCKRLKVPSQPREMLVVHHGLFWGKPVPIVGRHRRRVQTLLAAGCSLYACHLPLDRHPEVGNNAQLAARLGLQRIGGFGEAFGVPIGIIGEAPEGMALSALAANLEGVTGARPLVLAGGPTTVRRVAILSGDGAREIPAAFAAGCDTYVTGEHSHVAYHDAAEYGINVSTVVTTPLKRWA